METKWRFRTGPGESTGKPVPQPYWDLRSSDPKRAQELLGGKGFVTKKEDGVWTIFRQGERVEHDNPADYYNTCLKMAKKRALVDAVLTCTAASDIFTQDVEELVDNGVIVAEVVKSASGSSPSPGAAPEAAGAPAPAPAPPSPVTEGERTEADLRADAEIYLNLIGAHLKVTPADVLVRHTMNKEGKYGKKLLKYVDYKLPKKDGGEWSPLAALVSKLEAEARTLGLLAPAPVEDESGLEDVPLFGTGKE